MTHEPEPSAPAVGWQRPTVPSEGEKDFLDEHPFDLQRSALPDSVLVEQVTIPMRDGITLAGTLFRPQDESATVPVIATATPYGKDRYDQWDYFRDAPTGNVPGGGFYMGTVHVSDHTAFEAPDPGYWVPSGYAVLLVDLPGLGASQSNPAAGIGHQERWADVMSWLETQPWCSGQAGMSGVSALCATQWIAAMGDAPPQLKAIIPWEGFNEQGPGGGYGGIPETAFPAWIGGVWVGPNINPDAPGPEPFLFDWKHDPSTIRVPALVCASFSDQELHSWDTFEAFRLLDTQDKWLYTHRRQKWGAFYGADELKLQKRFLDKFLKGSDDELSDVPRVRLEINESRFTYTVQDVSQWPPAETRYRELYLDAQAGSLSPQPPATASSAAIAPAPTSDPVNRAVFDLLFTEDTDVVGNSALRLFVETKDSTDADLFIGVEKLDTDGNEVYFFSASGGNANGPVTRGWLRASKRALNKERSTDARPVLSYAADEPLTPGETVQVDIPLMPTATRFRAGETLRLVIQSWSDPGQWEGGETRQWDTIQTGQTLLHTGPQAHALLLLPTLETGEHPEQ
jgi:predicted acyl esterase